MVLHPSSQVHYTGELDPGHRSYPSTWLFFNFFFSFFFNFLAELDLLFLCFSGTFSSCSKQGLALIEVHGLLTVLSSLTAEHRLIGTRASEAAVRRLSI